MTRPHGFVVRVPGPLRSSMWYAAVATIHHFGLDSGSHSQLLTRHHGCDIDGTPDQPTMRYTCA